MKIKTDYYHHWNTYINEKNMKYQLWLVLLKIIKKIKIYENKKLNDNLKLNHYSSVMLLIIRKIYCIKFNKIK